MIVRRLWPVLAAVGEGVLLPVGVYLLLTASGARDVIALTGSAAASVVLLGIGWLRTRTLNALGVLVLIRFSLSLLLLGFTSDARLLLVKDATLTCLTGLAILASLMLEKSFILRDQRDLAPDKDAFDHQLLTNRPLGRAYRRSTLLWGVGLTAEPFLEIVIVYSATLTTAVILCNGIGTILILSLIIITQLSVGRTERAGKPWCRGRTTADRDVR